MNTCDKCKFYDTSQDDRFAVCRRNPPRRAGNSIHGLWPIVEPDDWCGEFILSVKSSTQERQEAQDKYAKAREENLAKGKLFGHMDARPEKKDG